MRAVYALRHMLFRVTALFAQAGAAIRAADDPAATEALAERLLDDYGTNILRLAYSYLHNGADAEEIVSDTLIRYMSSAPAFESTNHEKAWLLKVASNLCKNRLDYNRYRRTDELSETIAADDREDLSFVWDAVRELDVRYREVIHLHYYEGYSTAEIGAILGLNESTVRSRLMRGRKQLKGVLKEAYDFD